MTLEQAIAEALEQGTAATSLAGVIRPASVRPGSP